MRIMRDLALASVLGLVAATQSGCLIAAGAAGTGGTVAYVSGDTEAVMDGNPEEVTAAGEEAVEELNLTLVSAESDDLKGKVVARTARDKRLTIVVRSEGEGRSRVSIRAGTFGDSTVQQRVLEEMQNRLEVAALTDDNDGGEGESTESADTTDATDDVGPTADADESAGEDEFEDEFEDESGDDAGGATEPVADAGE